MGVGSERLGQAEVAYLRLPVGIEQDVGRLEIPMDDPKPVGFGDGASHGLD